MRNCRKPLKIIVETNRMKRKRRTLKKALSGAVLTRREIDTSLEELKLSRKLPYGWKW